MIHITPLSQNLTVILCLALILNINSTLTIVIFLIVKRPTMQTLDPTVETQTSVFSIDCSTNLLTFAVNVLTNSFLCSFRDGIKNGNYMDGVSYSILE